MLTSFMVTLVLFATPAGPRTWTVSGPDVTFEMSSEDLRGLRKGQEVFGLQSRKAEFLEGFKPAENTDTSNWEGMQSFRVLSVVGPWVSYEQSEGGYTGGAHPYAGTRYVTRDVTKGPDGFSLLDVFGEEEVVKALKADAFVRKHVTDAAAFKKARTVADLMESLVPGQECVGFEYGLEAVKHAVAFHHLERGKVALRIAFGYANEVCRGSKFVVGLLLPIPPALRPALEKAARREEGFLMKDHKAAGAPTVTFTWEPSSAPQP
ncbi:hypothetical protein MYSTI_05837 [Myxococcus stipitatus DSM 14675]|uniref:Uncharacterized protein n=1 Tax=Myxococcus stipitatus (strain DSM 14675 / JCM 12634 / Mx s8) TaxID=1278073 RepID=L7UGE7_MYXSD|nr:hypothetical protein [Myxococcus stipitatus]AGC47113.1 hypothetical protein MYSTI_05837 [Myxococcus stipitatus DSM 14675]